MRDPAAHAVSYNNPSLLARKTKMKASARKVASQGCLPIGHLPCSLISRSRLPEVRSLCEHRVCRKLKYFMVRLHE
jgi:hypothetical protein